MKKIFMSVSVALLPLCLFAQTGHIMQGIGAANMSMGGAATGQPVDISGTINWNPAGIAAFNSRVFSANAGVFFSSPEISSVVTGAGGSMSGTTNDDRGISIMPSVAMLWGNPNSKHVLAVSAFGISGFGVTFPQSNNNPITSPQSSGGFGRIESDYQLMQVGFTYAYRVSGRLSFGFAPTFNYSALELAPNPLSSPSPEKGYPVSNKATALGIGGQFGIFYNSTQGFKLGASYKTQQYFGEFEFENKYLDGSAAPKVKFRMNYPAILSAGIGYSNKEVDAAIDYRLVNYEGTKGFSAKGWTSTASVKGFGWKNMSVVSAGIQYKGLKKVPLRAGYTYSSNPIDSELAFFSAPATAIIKHAWQVGCGFDISKHITLNGTYHHGTSAGSTTGPLLHPMMVTPANPYGAIPGSSVSYKMTTDLVMVGLTYNF